MLTQELVSNLVEHKVPIRVRWHGWESNTYVLRNMGWKIFAHEALRPDYWGKSITIGVRDPDGKMLLRGELSLTREHFSQFNSGNPNELLNYLLSFGVELNVYIFSDMVTVHRMEAREWNSLEAMRPIDGCAYTDRCTDRHNLSEVDLFKYVETAQEIYLPYTSVDECLSRILQLQYPKQQEIKKDGIIQVPVIQAKIYSLAA